MFNINKLNRKERMELEIARAKDATSGTGRFLFRNSKKTDINLPKPSLNGKIEIRAGEQFEGDSYFFQLVQLGELTYVKEIENQMNEEMQTERLILDQPDIVTTEGTVEYVKEIPSKKCCKKEECTKKEDKLILEVPDDGDLEILNDQAAFVILE